MRLKWLILAMFVWGSLHAQQDPGQLRRLVEEGALPKNKLVELEESLKEAEDQAILSRYLSSDAAVENLTEAQAAGMVAAAERMRDRQQARLDVAAKLVEKGVASRNSLLPFEEELGRRRQTVALAQDLRKLLLELVEMARAEQEAETEMHEPLEDRYAVALRFEGDGRFTQADWRTIVLAYEKEFGRSLPVSARGETRLHRSMGLDHRGRIDVALNPDQEEGVWLRRFLESERIPYFAFRRYVPGKATAPHIHIGPPSLRLRAAD